LKKTVCTLAALTLLMLAMLICGDKVTTVQATTEIQGVITSDAAWTMDNSPYTLTGQVTVDENATLTVEPGVVVNLDGSSLQINGTLTAVGAGNGSVTFNAGTIIFAPSSLGWNVQNANGSTIQNASVNRVDIVISNTSPKIDSCNITGYILINGCSIDDPNLPIAKPAISNCNLTASGHVFAIENAGLPTITNNTIKGQVSSSGDCSSVIANNTIVGGVDVYGDYVVGNVLMGGETGIKTFNSVVEKNLIMDNTHGILLRINGNATIQNNTIVNNVYGISIPGYSAACVEKGGLANSYFNIQVHHNNILANSGFNVYLYKDIDYPLDDVDASDNYWGITDQQAINQTLHDHKNDIHLGTVTFIPFLTSPSAGAPPIPESALPTPTPTPDLSTAPPMQTPTPTPAQKDIFSGFTLVQIVFIDVMGVLAVFLVILVIYTVWKRSKPSAQA
jgi:parallel beta-helix repeat protein